MVGSNLKPLKKLFFLFPSHILQHICHMFNIMKIDCGFNDVLPQKPSKQIENIQWIPWWFKLFHGIVIFKFILFQWMSFFYSMWKIFCSVISYEWNAVTIIKNLDEELNLFEWEWIFTVKILGGNGSKIN